MMIISFLDFVLEFCSSDPMFTSVLLGFWIPTACIPTVLIPFYYLNIFYFGLIIELWKPTFCPSHLHSMCNTQMPLSFYSLGAKYLPHTDCMLACQGIRVDILSFRTQWVSHPFLWKHILKFDENKSCLCGNHKCTVIICTVGLVLWGNIGLFTFVSVDIPALTHVCVPVVTVALGSMYSCSQGVQVCWQEQN